MAITTNVPSSNFEDLQRDVQDATRFTNGTQIFTTRSGKKIRPIPLQAQDIANNLAQSEQALANSGFIPKGDFTTGGTVEAKNEIFSDGTDYWRYDGVLPFTVAAGSSPTPVGVGAWINVADGAIRSQLAAEQSTVVVDGKEAKAIPKRVSDRQFNASPSKTITENNAAFQSAIDALPATGGDIDVYEGDYTSVLDPSSLTVSNKALNFILRGESLLPSGMPGVIKKKGRYAIPESSIQADRNVRVHEFFDVGSSLAETNTRQYVYHVSGFLDEDGTTTESEFRGYSYDIGTDANSLNREVRGIKGRAYANGGGSNVRGMYSFVESVDNSGFTGILTGFLATVHRNSGNTPSESVGVRSHMDNGTTAAFQAAGAGINPATDTVSFAYSCRTGTGQPIMPNEACFQAHGGASGDMFLGYESNTNPNKLQAPFRVKNDGVVKGTSFFSKNYTISDDGVQAVTPPAVSGMVEVFAELTSGAFGKCYYRASGSPLAQEAYSGAITSFLTGALTGTTGVDGEITISAASDGNIYIENRSGAARSVVVNFTAYTIG